MRCIVKKCVVYWAIQRSWFARVNALCNLSRKKSREVAAHFRADFWVGVASRCVQQWKLNLESRSSTNANTVAVAKITVERWWRVGRKKKCLCLVFWLTRSSRVRRKNCVLGHPIARATSYCLFSDTLWLRASKKNAFKVGSIKFANSLSPPSIVKKVRTGSKSSQGT